MINIYDKYTNIDHARQSTNNTDTAHGLEADQISAMAARFEQFTPGLASKMASSNTRNLFEESLPKGATWDPRNKTAQNLSLGNQGRNLVTTQTPYQPEFASPDRQNYPVHRILANRYWRLFYKLDPIIGNCIELYSDLPWSNFELTGDGVEGEIKQSYEHMCRETQVLAMLPYFVREFLITGEAVPHTFFDNSKGIFTHIAMHNPDQLEVIDAPFIKMDPILEFIPDDRLRSVLTSNAPALRDVRDRMPPELLQRLQARQHIPLSPINATFIPRKLHPYDTRGTSILSRLWRILMYEDAVFNASIQMARRHASPLKVAKLGNAATGWIPPPEQEKRLLELLAQAEMDPNAWLVYHYGIQFETIGTSDRFIGINREWDIIERIKLVALGISKSFLNGETSYASSATGLQVFLQRLKSMRLFFEQKWLYPKFFKPVAEINGWIKPKPSEVNHHYRIKRSSRELDEANAYIVPRIVWDKSLDPQINTDLIQAMTALESMGVKFSKTTKMAQSGFSFEDEVKKIHREDEFEKAYLPDMPAAKPSGGGGGGIGGGGSMPPTPSEGDVDEDAGGPPPPPGVDGQPAVGQPPAPAGASSSNKTKPGKAKDKSLQEIDKPKPTKSTYENLKSTIWTDDKFGNWDAEEVSGLVGLLTELESDSAFWTQMADKGFKKVLLTGDPDSIWQSIEDYLASNNYPDSDISELHNILIAEGQLVEQPSEDVTRLKAIEEAIPDNASDEEFATAVAKVIKSSSNKLTPRDSFLVGSSDPTSGLSGDVSDLLRKK